MSADTTTTTSVPLEPIEGDHIGAPPQPTTTVPATTTTTVPLPARPERFPQSTIPGDNLGVCYLNDGGVLEHGQYSQTGVLPGDGRTELGAQPCWGPEEVIAVDTFQPEPTTATVTVPVQQPEPVVGQVPVPTAVNTGSEIVTGGEAVGYFIASFVMLAVAVGMGWQGLYRRILRRDETPSGAGTGAGRNDERTRQP